ncbi:unnamed protein product [Mucor hiemalis]
MRDIINRHIQDPDFNRYSDFFFLSFAYGTKTVFHYENVVDETSFDAEFERCINDINWKGIDRHLKVVCDFAVNITKAENKRGKYSGVWISRNITDGNTWPQTLNNLQCRLLQQLGFVDSEVVASRYRHDTFALFRGLGGFHYSASKENLRDMNSDGSGGGEGRYNLLSMQPSQLLASWRGVGSAICSFSS